jgi:hypothetical protein
MTVEAPVRSTVSTLVAAVIAVGCLVAAIVTRTWVLTAVAGGCVVGNIMSGYALMSVGNILFGITTLLANWAATYVYLMGGLRR